MSTSRLARPTRFSSLSLFFHSCDCPNHKVSNATWPGTPALAPALASNFGAVLAGQFLVSRPAGGVSGEGPDLFPTASDYHLVCLQHDGAASLTVDGATVYEGGLSAEAAAGKRDGRREKRERPAHYVHALTGASLSPSHSHASSSTARPSC